MSSSISIPTSLDVAENVTNAIEDYEFLKFFDFDYKANIDLDYSVSNARRVIYLAQNRPTNNDKYITDLLMKKCIGEFLYKIEIITQANKKLRARIKTYKEQNKVFKRHEKYEKSKQIKKVENE
ncbi:hypothetical protein UFOVP733_8 [uncultured Caudovirales phage]|uniref:Uncharacterized protein n=1 Tax=uncultured Caudovirales phage TaxID=2100421 RepID=A0A6J7X385_9CAUD|nr:hypothetical protein UFOVP733_8 [uncultured Caudovirales phage]CAB5224962.1 hypothetical protein UFOVP743_51 [uncultured Caudovirales phage]